MNINEVYEEYNIMPLLREHMLRVAGVASLISDNFEQSINKNDIIKTCLLHDMGNIIKFQLEVFPESLKPRGLEYWQEVQKEYIANYSEDEHNATIGIIKELGISKKVLDLVDIIGFNQAIKNLEHKNFEMKICAYSDMRVAPNGVTSLNERLLELEKRYQDQIKNKHSKESFTKHADALREIEKQIFQYCQINPIEITQEAVNPLIENLRNFEL